MSALLLALQRYLPLPPVLKRRWAVGPLSWETGPGCRALPLDTSARASGEAVVRRAPASSTAQHCSWHSCAHTVAPCCRCWHALPACSRQCMLHWPTHAVQQTVVMPACCARPLRLQRCRVCGGAGSCCGRGRDHSRQRAPLLLAGVQVRTSPLQEWSGGGAGQPSVSGNGGRAGGRGGSEAAAAQVGSASALRLCL